MERLLSEYEPSQVVFTVCDISKDSDAAQKEQITFTPTLVRRSPEPRVWVIGDLEDPSAVIRMLHAAGVRRRADDMPPLSMRPVDSQGALSSRSR
jgi:hypothetical protein